MAAAIERTRQFIGEVTEEMKKVTWPDRAQLKQATFIVLVFIMIVSVIIWVMDLGVRTVLSFIINLFAR